MFIFKKEKGPGSQILKETETTDFFFFCKLNMYQVSDSEYKHSNDNKFWKSFQQNLSTPIHETRKVNIYYNPCEKWTIWWFLKRIISITNEFHKCSYSK